MIFSTPPTGHDIEGFTGVQVPAMRSVLQTALPQQGLRLALFGHGQYAVFVVTAKFYGPLSSVSFRFLPLRALRQRFDEI